MVTKFNMKYEFERDIYNEFLDLYRSDEEFDIYTDILAQEAKLKFKVSKAQRELYEKLVALKNDLHELECLRLIKFVMKNYENSKKWTK